MGALERFDWASAASRSLASAKGLGMLGVTAAYEDVLDRAYAEVAEVAEGLGEKHARVVEGRWLCLMGWAEVADDCGVSVRTARRMAEQAFEWLDGRDENR